LVEGRLVEMDKEPKEKKVTKKGKKEEKVEELTDAAQKKPSFNPLLAILLIFKYTLMSSIVLAIVGSVVYLTLANLAFFGFLPSTIAEKMPVVNNIVKDIVAKEKRIQLAKEQKEDLNKIKKAGELQIDLLEAADIDGKNFVPFLYKLRVVKNQINNKELAEIWVDNVLVMRIFAGIGDNLPYARATYVVRQINKFLNDKADFNQLMPVIDGDTYKAEIAGEELFRVSAEDAIFNNSTQIELLYAWVNNLRVSLGASLFQVPKFIVKKTDIPEEKKEQAVAETVPGATATVPGQVQPDEQVPVAQVVPLTVTEEEQARIKRLKAVVKVYEKMPEAKVTDILKKMQQEDIADILKYLSVKKTAKSFPLMPAGTVVAVYRKMIASGAEAEQAKAFKKYIQIWEKMSEDELIIIFRNLSTEEKLAIFRKLSVKKKAKLFEIYPATEAKRYLQLLEEPPK